MTDGADSLVGLKAGKGLARNSLCILYSRKVVIECVLLWNDNKSLCLRLKIHIQARPEMKNMSLPLDFNLL